jgi:hypothetical protein
MIVIKILQITPDRSTINVSVETSVGDTISSAKLWTNQTFKDYTQAISLDTKLQGATNKEVFSVDVSELGLPILDGIYFVEFTSTDNNPLESTCTDCNNNIALGVTADLGYFQECLLDNVLEIQFDTSDVVNNNHLEEIFNIKMLMDALITSIKFGYYQEAIDIIDSLSVLCRERSTCSSCNKLDTPIFKSGLNFVILNNNLILQ